MILTKEHQSLVLVVGLGVLGAYLVGRLAADKAVKAAQAVNPLNNENVFYNATNSVGSVLTQDEHFTLGGFIYDVLNPVEVVPVDYGSFQNGRD
jgi:ketopantoate reductase